MSFPAFPSLSAPWVETLGFTLLHFVWQGFLIALLYAFADRLLDHRGAKARYLVATIALGLLLLTPTATFWWLSLDTASPSGITATATHLEAAASPGPTGLVAATAPAETSSLTTMSWLGQVVQVWALGVCLLALRLAAGWLATRRLRRRGRRLGDPLRNVVDELRSAMNIRRRVDLLFSRDVEVLTVIGWVTPAILVPAGALMGLSPFQLRAILAHELAHVKRHDHLVNLVQMLAETLFFYHPAVWWVSHRLRIERENACDDTAVALCGDAVGYARALAELEALRPPTPRFALAANGGSLIKRVSRLVRPEAEPTSPWFPGSFFAALLAVLTVLVPPLVANPGPQAESTTEPVDLVSGQGDDTKAEELERARLYEEIESDRAAGRENPQRSVPNLLEKLANSTGKTREKVIWTLGHVGDETAVPPLVEALDDDLSENRSKAAWALGKVGDERAVEALADRLRRDESLEVQQSAVWALGMIGDERAVEPLIEALEGSEPSLRRKAAWSLGKRADARAAQPLAVAAQDADPELRDTAIWALGHVGGAAAVAALEELLDDPDPEIRESAVWSMGTLMDTSAIAALTEVLLEDSALEVRGQAAWALGMIGDERANPALTRAMDDPEPRVQERVAKALKTIRVKNEAERARLAAEGAQGR